MMSDRLPRLALRPCRISEPTIECLTEELVEAPRRSVLREIFGSVASADQTIWGTWGFPADSPLAAEWRKLRPGDEMLFYARRTFFARGRIIRVTENARAARLQWPRSDRDYPYLALFGAPKRARLALDDFNALLRFRPAFRPQGFRVLDDAQSAVIAGALLRERPSARAVPR